jgi:RND family efflux transporter MFP subunit
MSKLTFFRQASLLFALCHAIAGLTLPSISIASDDYYSLVPAVDCVINPFQVADIASPVTGVIEKLHVARSQQVTAGQSLLQLNADVERANVDLANYRARIRSEIELGRINVDFDKSRKDRFDSLYQQKVIAVDDVDEVEREARLSRWRLEQARELARVRELELLRAQQQLRQKTIVAPFDGFVIDTFKYPGEQVEDQAILRLAQLDPLVVEAIVPMEYFGEIQVDMLAEVIPEILVDDRLSARVSVIDRIGDTASNTFGIRLVLDNPDHLIPAGLKCTVKFTNQFAPPSQPEDSPEEPSPEMPVTIQADTEVGVGGQAKAKSPPDTASPLDQAPDPVEKKLEAPARFSAGGDDRSETQISKNDSYLVLIDQRETGQATRDLIAQLKTAGIDDLLKFDHGPHQGTISLGLYDARTTAERRASQLAELGFDAFIKQR